ncbi:MAG TPA: SDR family oxidoreductase [Candidatus Paenibacillus intestinavium]|nr:SDR family oxidoreductase [Candidatus Paenibacillus intestinavium]
MNFNEKVVLVTGGSRGIGRSICFEAAKLGATVVINYNSKQEQAEEVCTYIQAQGGTASIYQADVSDQEQVQKMMAFIIERYGKIDVLINNAGISNDRLIFQMEPEDWQKVMNVNFGGVFNCSKAAIESMMLERSGVIVNVSSAMSVGGWVGQSNYACSKAAINAFTRTAAVELARFNIRVCAVLPGFSETEMVEGLLKEEKRYLSQIPQKRFGKPEEIAKTVLFLASDDASHITGATLKVDGGASCTLGIGRPL